MPHSSPSPTPRKKSSSGPQASPQASDTTPQATPPRRADPVSHHPVLWPAGTHWHGAFESDGFRRAFLAEAARLAGRHGFRVAPDTRFAAVRERTLDLLGDLVEEHLDTSAVLRLLEDGLPSGLPDLDLALRLPAGVGA